MRISVIDLGTNTCHLLIAEIKVSSYKKIYSEINPVKLWKDGITKGFINNAAIDRAKSIFNQYYSICKKYNVDLLYAIATAAVRQSDNKQSIIKNLKDEIGIELNVIDGNTEALLIYEGVKLALPQTSKSALIMDIGGGSVEFVITSNYKTIWKKSFATGAAFLLEKFNGSDPITLYDIKQIENFLQKNWKELFRMVFKFNPNTFIGASGSFQTLCDLHHKKTDSVSIFHTLSKAEYDYMANRIVHSNRSQRMHMPGMQHMRIEMIVYAVIMITFVLNQTKFTEIHYSNYALKEGLCNLILLHPKHEMLSNLNFIKL